MGRTLIGFPGHRKSHTEEDTRVGMHAKTRTDTHTDAHVHACELANFKQMWMRTHVRTQSTCRLVLPHYYGWQGVSGPLLFSKGSL